MITVLISTAIIITLSFHCLLIRSWWELLMSGCCMDEGVHLILEQILITRLDSESSLWHYSTHLSHLNSLSVLSDAPSMSYLGLLRRKLFLFGAIFICGSLRLRRVWGMWDCLKIHHVAYRDLANLRSCELLISDCGPTFDSSLCPLVVDAFSNSVICVALW